MPRPDQLLVAIIRTPRAVCRAVLASAMATAKRLVDQFSLRVAVGEAFALRPDTRVNNTDNDVFSGSVMRSRASRTAQLIPQAAGIRKPEEAGRRRCLDFLKLVWCDRENVALFRDSRGLLLSKLRSKAIEAKRIAINLWAAADLSNGFVVSALEITDVTQSIRREWVNPFAPAGSRGVVPTDVTSIRDDRRSFHLDDVHTVLRCGLSDVGRGGLCRY